MTHSPQISVIVCAHNPRSDYLRRVLEALRIQSLRKDEWEVLLVDNASSEPLSAAWDLAWHPAARHIREDELGLTAARLRGIRESRGALLVFVDDDNVLDADYLETARDIASSVPQIGAFGASTRGEFDVPPPEWIVPHLDGLAICELAQDHLSYAPGWSLATPYGAGLCVRRAVADDYAEKASTTPLRKILGRTGARLGAGEDSDLAWCAIDIGMGTGRFCSLRLTHLIPGERLTEAHVIRLQAGFAASEEIAAVLRPDRPVRKRASWRRKAALLVEWLRTSGLERKILVASYRAREDARKTISAELGGGLK